MSVPKYDPEFTDRVVAATGPKANRRLAEIMPSLLRHLHDFAREVDLTVAECMAGLELINEAGRMSTDQRNETQLLCDILGLESLVDEITTKVLSSTSTTPATSPSSPNHNHHNPSLTTTTPSAILGPFYRSNAPILPSGSTIVHIPLGAPWVSTAVAETTHIHGLVLSPTHTPIAGALIDVWHTAPNGLYEQQDPEQSDMNLRGRFLTDDQGHYSFYCLRPVSYPIPDDGPAGRLLKMLDRHPYRPAHVHFIVQAEGWRGLTTQIFDRRDRYTGDDAVFAVKEALVVDFRPKEGDERCKFELEYDFVLGDV